MKSSVFVAFVFATGMALFSMPANAQATRTWISGVGDDANPCSRTAPCKTFAGAISKTASGGEIDALDPGGFGALTITKSITLDGGGGQVASILVSGTNGITVAGGSTDVVIIRNLRFDGLLGNGGSSGTAGINGINFISGAALIVEKCEIFGFASNGINIAPNQTAKVSISETHIQNSSFNAATGDIFVAPSTGTTTVMVNNVYMEGGLNGVQVKTAGGAVNLDVRNSVATGYVNSGVVLNSANGAVTGDIFNAQLSGGADGLAATGAGATARVGTSTITHNTTGVTALNSSTIQSYKNNMIFDNGTDGTPITAVNGYSGNTGQ